jgi:hypothetical protein
MDYVPPQPPLELSSCPTRDVSNLHRIATGGVTSGDERAAALLTFLVHAFRGPDGSERAAASSWTEECILRGDDVIANL